MRVVMCIMREEWRALYRHLVALPGLGLLSALMLVAALNAWEYQRTVNTERMLYQTQANQEFAAQPDRHPHRVAHFGHFLFRPLNPLAAFDPGIDAYTGNTLFLEAHRQNSANFGDVRQSSLLLRFGQLTPAFVLQVLAPLLLIFVGYAGVTRERESGTLSVLLAQGVTGRQMVLGKLLALSGCAGLILLPMLTLLCVLVVSGQTHWPQALLLTGGYSAWLLLWSLLIVLVSTLPASGRDALLALLAAWTVLVILLPRWIPEQVNMRVALPTRFENEILVEREYQALGDPHNPDDAKFAEFRDQMLREYGVARIEDLPVNFKGLVGMEGERQSSALFSRYATEALDLQERQNRMLDHFGWLTPALALRRLSMVAADTDLTSFRRFLEQGEQYRYDLVQGLNRLQAEHLHYHDDSSPERENRLSHRHWQAFPPFHYAASPLLSIGYRAAPAGGVLALWILWLGGLLWLAGGRLGRKGG